MTLLRKSIQFLYPKTEYMKATPWRKRSCEIFMRHARWICNRGQEACIAVFLQLFARRFSFPGC